MEREGRGESKPRRWELSYTAEKLRSCNVKETKQRESDKWGSLRRWKEQLRGTETWNAARVGWRNRKADRSERILRLEGVKKST